MRAKKLVVLMFLAFVIFLAGCSVNSKLMPSSKELAGGLGDYNGIESLYNSIKPGKTTVSDLVKMGLDPKTTPNVNTFNYLNVEAMFLTSPSQKFEDLPLEIQDCVKNKGLCFGLGYGPYKNLNTKGEGNFLARLAKCKKIDIVTGWELGFFLFRKGDLIVYKIPGKDMPKVHITREEKRPLCFLQETLDPAKFVPAPY